MSLYSSEDILIVKAEDYELYRYIKNGYDMAKWIALRMQNGHSDLEFEIISASDTYVDGIIESFLFRVEIYDKSRVLLKIVDYEETDELLDTLKNIITPTIWHLGKKNKGKNVYRSEILRYSIGSQGGRNFEVNDDIELYNNFGSTEDSIMPLKSLVWDVEKPVELITDILKQHIDGNIRINTIECYYPGVNLEILMEDLYYGFYSGCIDDTYAKHVQTCGEFELFYTIKTIRDELLKYNRLFKTGSAINDTEKFILNNYFYVHQFLVQQVRRFGIKVGIPDIKFNGQTVEFAAWFAWWEEAFNELISEKPNIFDEWKQFKAGFDVNFRPKTSFETFSSNFKQKVKEAENARKLKQEEFLKGKIKNPEEIKRLREIRKVQSRTVLGRVKNFLQNVNDNTSKKILEKSKCEQSPYDYI